MTLLRLGLVLPVALLACEVDDGQDEQTDAGPDDPDGSAGDATLGPNDVSVLFPLNDAAADELLAAATAGRGGPLLPRPVFDQIGQDLTNRVTGADATYDALRVVAFRYDPCFIHSWGGFTCQPQIRLVLQVIGELDGSTVAHDGAIHLLYNLDAEEHDTVLAALREAAALAPEAADDDPLGVHPALVAQGVDGAFGTALRSLITSHAGPTTLARMTFMVRTLSRAGEWVFGAVGVKVFPSAGFGETGPLELPMIDSTTQAVISNTPAAEGFVYSVIPLFGEEGGRIGTSSDSIQDVRGDPALKEGLEAWISAVHDPTVRSADMIDCASCHLAGHIRRTALALDLDVVDDPRFLGERVVYDAEVNTDNLRAFGYFDREPVVSQRTANETAYVVGFLKDNPSGQID